jgi:hypothetical protein
VIKRIYIYIVEFVCVTRVVIYHNARKESCKSEPLFPFSSRRVSLKKQWRSSYNNYA